LVSSLLLLPVVAPAAGQDSRAVSMEEAVREALTGNRSLAAAEARAQAVSAGARGADSFLWPTLGVEAGTIHTNDPVGVFGAKLRQGRFAQEDLGLEALNHPDGVTDWSAAAGVRWAIVDPSSWAGRDAAKGEADAALLGVRRSREATEFQARVLYLNATRALARLEAGVASESAAEANLDLIRRRRDEGILTDADVFQAEAELQGAEASRIYAEQQSFDARSRLGVFLAWGDSILPLPTDRLATPEGHGSGGTTAVNPAELPGRADLRAMEAGAEVARARAKQASRVRLPALEAFGRAAVHSESLDRFEDNWTVGVQLRWPVFTGFAAESGKDQALAQARAMELEREEALLAARAELDEATRSVVSAGRRVDATTAAARSAAEARRLVERRFQEGMATTVDLLQAEARLTDMRARAVDALADYHIAVARLEFVGAASTEPSR
jgi:outer membrane protein